MEHGVVTIKIIISIALGTIDEAFTLCQDLKSPH